MSEGVCRSEVKSGAMTLEAVALQPLECKCGDRSGDDNDVNGCPKTSEISILGPTGCSWWSMALTFSYWFCSH